MSRALLTLSGGSVHGYATISDDSLLYSRSTSYLSRYSQDRHPPHYHRAPEVEVAAELLDREAGLCQYVESGISGGVGLCRGPAVVTLVSAVRRKAMDTTEKT